MSESNLSSFEQNQRVLVLAVFCCGFTKSSSFFFFKLSGIKLTLNYVMAEVAISSRGISSDPCQAYRQDHGSAVGCPL